MYALNEFVFQYLVSPTESGEGPELPIELVLVIARAELHINKIKKL